MTEAASSYYPVLAIDPNTVEDEEQLGSKPKFWFRHEGRRWLFKEVRPNTGEHWAEKVAAELALLLEVPSARVELAECLDKRGCAVESFIVDRRRQFLVHGNEVLAGTVTGYDMEKRFRQSDHTLSNIIRCITGGRIFGGAAMRAAAEQLCGYVTLDALIGNTDRHHENWGLLGTPTAERQGIFTIARMEVAPSFDHASSLGRELLDEERLRRLDEKTILSYIHKGRGGIYGKSSDKHGLSPLEAALRARKLYPEFFALWWQKLADLDEEKMLTIVNRIPGDWMSAPARDFALAFLRISRQKLLTSTPAP